MSHTVELDGVINCAVKGEKQDIDFVTLSAPNYKQIDKFIPIKQAVMRAVTDIGEGSTATAEKDSDDDSKLTGKQVMLLLMQSKHDTVKVMLHCAELFKSGAALVGGEIKMTQLLIDQLSVADFEKLVGEYIANFIVPSLMDGV